MHFLSILVQQDFRVYNGFIAARKLCKERDDFMFTVSKANFVNAMSKESPAALTVPSGSRLVFETNDALDGQVKDPSQGIASLDWGRVNPATGPVAVEGAMPGDAIKVAIEKIEATGSGVMAAIPGFGLFGSEVTVPSVRLMPLDGDTIPFSDEISLPIRMMIGVIGTAPAGGPVPCGTPGSHGGNMDCKKIAPGNTLYLPVFHPGGLLALGDVHSCMGDGEVMGTGVECPADVTVIVELEKGFSIPDPLMEVGEMIYSVASADTLENASKKAAGNIRVMVEKKMNLGPNDAGMLLSAIGELEICQVVDPLMTVRFGMPKKYVL